MGDQKNDVLFEQAFPAAAETRFVANCDAGALASVSYIGAAADAGSLCGAVVLDCETRFISWSLDASEKALTVREVCPCSSSHAPLLARMHRAGYSSSRITWRNAFRLLCTSLVCCIGVQHVVVMGYKAVKGQWWCAPSSWCQTGSKRL
jgi:hypothetical protein